MDYDQAIRGSWPFGKEVAHAWRAGAYTYLDKPNEAKLDIEKAVELGYDSATLEREIEEVESHFNPPTKPAS